MQTAIELNCIWNYVLSILQQWFANSTVKYSYFILSTMFQLRDLQTAVKEVFYSKQWNASVECPFRNIVRYFDLCRIEFTPQKESGLFGFIRFVEVIALSTSFFCKINGKPLLGFGDESKQITSGPNKPQQWLWATLDGQITVNAVVRM